MQVSKAVVGAVAAAFAVMLAVIFFLLGRESGQHRVLSTGPVGAPTATAPEATAAPPVEARDTTTPTPPAMTTPPPASDPWQAPPTSSPRPAVATASPTASPTTAPRASNAIAIRDYFIRMQSIQAVGLGGDTNEIADSLLAGAMKGDSSGLDNVIKSLSDGVDKVKSIQPPPECTAYHDGMLALLHDSVELVRSLKTALASGDPSSIAGLALTGNSLKTRTDTLDAEGKAIRSRAGL